MSKYLPTLSLLSAVLLLIGCSAPAEKQQAASEPDSPAFLEALTFYSSFDGLRADVAKGDGMLYSAASRSAEDTTVAGLGGAPEVEMIADAGLTGGALRFAAKTGNVVFFRCKDNMAYSQESWSGTVSFWLKLDPAVDLEPGFCDPIQITDVNYNDAALWVDFTSENPRDFRLGVIGDLTHWDPTGIGPTDNPEFDKRLVVVNEPPFSRSKWTHIAITFQNLNANGRTSLYVDGQLQGSIEPHEDPFTWELSKANMYLGLNYVGLYDELSVYSRELSAEEITTLYSINTGLKSQL